MNAFNMEMLDELDEIMNVVTADDTVRAVVLKGNNDYSRLGRMSVIL